MDEADRARRLRRYEAEPTVVAREDGESPHMALFSPFGPMIARMRMPATLIERINGYADAVISPDQGSEFVIPPELAWEGGASSLAAITARFVQRYVRCVDHAEVKDVAIDVFWVVSQYAGTPSPVHFHSADISGVAYLRLPELAPDAREEETYISGRQAGFINFLIGGKQALSKSLVSFCPEVGDFYIFPGWLLHGAEPFRGWGERRSLAFNANLVY
jgi:hypothetical protein